MVECDLAKVEVAGSNPVSRSKKAQQVQMESENLPKLSPVPFPNGTGDLLFRGMTKSLPKYSLISKPSSSRPSTQFT